jgi:hypothetical protein
MIKKINTNLLRSIVETDFALLTGDLRAESRSLKQGVKLKRDCTLRVLDIFELVKNLKQFIRIIQFLKRQDHKNMYVCSSNKQILGILNKYLENSDSKDFIKVQNNFAKIGKKSNFVQSLLILQEPLNSHHNVFKKLFEKNILIVNKINSISERNNYGTYKIHNEIIDFKKLVFLIVLIKQTISTN